MRLMRMVSCCSPYAMFYHRSGMLLRCLTMLRYILAVCPANRLVCGGAHQPRSLLVCCVTTL